MKNKSSNICSLNPFLGQGDLIRIGSRLFYYIILPRKDANVKALIRAIHLSLHHKGP